MLIVAIHDVAPSTLAQARWLLARLDGAGVAPRVLKVIPAEPGATDDGIAALAELVAVEARAGSEIVLHGWTHRQAGQLRGDLTDRLRARAFAGDTAEFLALTPPQMVERLAAGVDRLQAWGADPVGFCPPAWLAGPGLAPSARVAGLRYVASIRGLRDLGRSRWLTLPPEGYMGAGRGQEALVRLGAAVLARPLSAALRAPAARIILHPQGAPDSAACAGVLRRVERLARRRRSTTYAELLDA